MKNIGTLLLIIFFSNSLFCQNTLQDSLQLHYVFDGNANDISGHNHNGTVFGAQLTENRFGQTNSAYEFDGSFDHINTFSTFDYEERTVSLWINPYDIDGFDPNNHIVISQDDYRLKYGCLRVDFENNYLNLWSGGANNLYTEEASEMRYKWSHIVMTRNSEEVKYYINGALVKTDNSNDIASSFDPDSTLVIGAGRSAYQQFFAGKIDDIRIYNRVLTDGEIQKLFLYDTQGYKEKENNSVSIFPNPTSNNLNITLSQDIGEFTINVYNSYGMIVLSFKNRKTINIENLCSGLYVLKVIGEKNHTQLTTKFIKN